MLIYPTPLFEKQKGRLIRRGLEWRIETPRPINLPLCTAEQWDALEETENQVIFDATATAIWGGPYITLPPEVRSAMRIIIDKGLLNKSSSR